LLHRSLGQAGLGLDPAGALVVSNLGSSGEDGVSIALGEAQALGTLIPLDPNNTPLGAYMNSQGTDNAGQPAGNIRMQRLADGYAVLPDFSSVGSPTYTVAIYKGPQLVYTQSGLTGPAVTMQINQPINLCCWWWWRCPWWWWGWWWHWWWGWWGWW